MIRERDYNTILSALRAAAKAVEVAASLVEPPPPQSPIRLESLLEAREPIEYSGRYSVEPIDPVYRLLSPKSIVLVQQQKLSRLGPAYFGVDSSSRSLSTLPGDFVVAAVAVSSSIDPLVCEHPPLEAGLSCGGGGEGFLYYLPNTLEPSEIPGGLGVSMANPAGHPYTRDYSLEQALDEARLRLENWALARVLPGIVEAVSQAGRLPVVLVDGPIFPLATALQNPRGVPREVYDAWRVLVSERVRVVRGLEEAGVPVIGVVKRLEHATIISRLASGIERLSSCLGGGGLYGDGAALLRYLSGCARRSPGSAYSSPRVRVRVEGLPVEGAGEKIVEYLIIPPGGLHWGPLGSRYYRLEYSPRTMGILEEHGIKASHLVIGDSAARGSREPITVRIADSRVKNITRSVRLLLASLAGGLGVPVSYDSLVEVESGWRAARARSGGASTRGW